MAFSNIVCRSDDYFPLTLCRQVGARNTGLVPMLINPRRLFPEFGLVPDFVSNRMEQGLSVDSRISSHPVEVPDLDVNDITQVRHILYSFQICSEQSISLDF